jgi:hypothetical protein
MTRTLLAAALLLATPALAQEAGGAGEAQDEGRGLIGEGAGLLLRGLVEEARPAVEGLAGISAEVLPTLRLLGQEMGPAFVEVFGRIDSITNYEPPAVQPNGDILIRRSPDAPAWTPPAAEAEAEPGTTSAP